MLISIVLFAALALPRRHRPGRPQPRRSSSPASPGRASRSRSRRRARRSRASSRASTRSRSATNRALTTSCSPAPASGTRSSPAGLHGTKTATVTLKRGRYDLLLHAAPQHRHEGNLQGQVVPAVRRLGPRSRGPSPNCSCGLLLPGHDPGRVLGQGRAVLESVARSAAEIQFPSPVRRDHEVGIGRQRVLDRPFEGRAARRSSAGKRSAR